MKTTNVSWSSNNPLDKLSLTEKTLLAVSLLGTMVLAFPQLATANNAGGGLPALEKVETKTPNAFRASILHVELITDLPPAIKTNMEVELADAEIARLQIRSERTAILKQFLISKKSPWANDEDAIELLANDLYHYRFVIGIGWAEGNLRHGVCNNYWGIGGTKPECYKTLSDAFIRADGLIDKYHKSSLNSPRKMRDRWVGWKNYTWPIAVEQNIKQLEAIGL